MEEAEFESLPNITPQESLAVLTDERPLALSFFGTDKGREMLRRSYFSCAHTNAELAEIFNTTPAAITAFISKQGWPAEREQSRKEGEIAQNRAILRQKIDEVKFDILEVAKKGIDHMKEEDFDGEMVLASAKGFRALAQTVTDLVPEDGGKTKVTNSILNIGSQVLIAE